MLKVTVGAVIVLVACAIGATAIQLAEGILENTPAQLVNDLVLQAGRAGDVQKGFEQQSERELFSNRKDFASQAKQLSQITETIMFLLKKLERSYSTKNLPKESQEKLLKFLPGDIAAEVAKSGELSTKSILTFYVSIKNDLEKSIAAFDRTLAEAKPPLSHQQLRKIGAARGVLTASLGDVTKLSGHIQELAFLNP